MIHRKLERKCRRGWLAQGNGYDYRPLSIYLAQLSQYFYHASYDF
jgi:hypothetical protein